MRTPRVLLLFEHPTLHGGERSQLAAMDAMPEGAFRFGAAAPPEGPLAGALRARGIALVPLRRTGPHGAARPREEVRAELLGILRARRPDLLHANSLSMGRLSGPVARRAGVPSLAHLRDILRLTPAALADLECHTRLLAVSRAVLEWHAATGLDRSRVRVLANGVDLERFRPRPPTGRLHRELGIPPGAPLLGALGQIGMRKGLDVLLEAAACIARERPDAHLVLAGDRFSRKEEAVRYEAGLHAVAARGPLAGRCHFLGYRDDVARLLGELTLLVHAARQEPLGRVLLEAAATGVPVLATRVGGTEEIFPEGSGAALLVPPDDPAALARAALRLLGDGEARHAMGAAARRRAGEAFDARHAGAALGRHYVETIEDGCTRHAREARP